MRRPLLIVLILIICVTFIYTNIIYLDESYDNDTVIIDGLVKLELQKKDYNEYKVDKFIVRDYSKKSRLKVGQIVEVKGKFKNLSKMKYDDFDYGRYIRSIGCKGIIYIKNYKITGNNKLYTELYNTKVYIRNTLRYLYKYNSDFLNSLLIGEKENLKQEEKEMFARTGTSHVIAISGLHTGILCTMIAFIMGKINRVYKLIILFLMIFLYNIMVGGSPSILRSIAFVVAFYLSIFIDKKIDGISILSLIGIILIINNPYIIYNLSFQLSFLATLSIIYFYGYINNFIKIGLISLTISSNILTLPIIYYNFEGMPLFSIIGNIVIVPFIAIIVYLSIMSIVSFKINIWIAKLLAYFNRVIINIIYFLLEKLSDLEFAYIEIHNPNKYYVIIYYLVVFLYMVYKELKVMKEQENELQGYYKEY